MPAVEARGKDPWTECEIVYSSNAGKLIHAVGGIYTMQRIGKHPDPIRFFLLEQETSRLIVT